MVCWGAEGGATPQLSIESVPRYVETVCEEARGQGLDKFLVIVAQANVAERTGELTAAEKLLHEALALRPTNAAAHSMMANLMIRQDRLAEARGWLRSALKEDANVEGGFRRLGMVLERLGDATGAKNAFQEALRRSAKDSTAHLLLGRLLLDAGKAEEAIPQLSKASDLEPNSPAAFYALSQAYGRTGDQLAAAKQLGRFQELKGRERAQDLAKLQLQETNTIPAIAAQFHCELAGAWIQAGQTNRALEHWNRALKLDAEFPPALEARAALALKRGEWARARTDYEKLLKMDSENADYQVQLGVVLLRSNEKELAAKCFERALELDPKNPQALNNLARFYLGSRRESGRALDLAKGLAQVEPNAAAYDLLAWAWYANGNLEEARKASAESVKLDPDEPKYAERLRRLNQLK